MVPWKRYVTSDILSSRGVRYRMKAHRRASGKIRPACRPRAEKSCQIDFDPTADT